MPRDNFYSPDSVDPSACWKIISECTLWISPPNTWMECNFTFSWGPALWGEMGTRWMKTSFLITEALKIREPWKSFNCPAFQLMSQPHGITSDDLCCFSWGEGLHQSFTSYADEKGCEQKHSQSIFATKILCFVEFIYTITLLSSRVEKKRNIYLYKMMKFIYVHDVTLVNIKLLTIYLGRKIIVLWGCKLNYLKYIIYKYMDIL